MAQRQSNSSFAASHAASHGITTSLPMNLSSTAGVAGSSTVASFATTLATAAISNVDASVPSSTAMDATSPEPSLDTRITVAFGVLGGLLIVSGIFICIAGFTYRRVALALVTLYTFATITFAFILQFGVARQVNPPSQAIMGAFLVGSLAAGGIAACLASIFHRGAKFIPVPVAGFMLGVTIQCLRDSGLIRLVGFRYLFFLGLTGLFTLVGMIPAYFEMVLMCSLSWLGALAFVVGIDCFTTQNLKEFMIFNLGFTQIFSKLNGVFPVTSGMQIELGIILFQTLFGIGVQFRLGTYLCLRLRDRFVTSARRTTPVDDGSEREIKRRLATVDADLEKFEHRYSHTGFPFKAASVVTPGTPSSSFLCRTPASATAPLLPALPYQSDSVNASLALDDAKQRSVEDEILAVQQIMKEIEQRRKEIIEMRKSLSLSESEASVLPTTSSAAALPDSLNERDASAKEVIKVNESRSPVADDNAPLSRFRPLSQGSQIIHPVRSSSDNSIASYASTALLGHPPQKSARRMSALSIQSSYSKQNLSGHIGGGQQHRRAQSAGHVLSSYNAPNIPNATSHHSGLAAVRVPEPAHVPPAPARIVTGVLPSAVDKTRDALPRPQSMDIRELDKKHRKRLSEIQGTSKPATSAPAEVGTSGSSKQGNSEVASHRISHRPHHARRASAQPSALISVHDEVDELGRKAETSEMQRQKKQSAPTVVAGGPRSGNDWLAY